MKRANAGKFTAKRELGRKLSHFTEKEIIL
jgi:hypothetical protein